MALPGLLSVDMTVDVDGFPLCAAPQLLDVFPWHSIPQLERREVVSELARAAVVLGLEALHTSLTHHRPQ